jgi:hypothetical protein
MLIKRQERWKGLKRTKISKGLMKIRKNIYDKCESSESSVVKDGKNLSDFKFSTL